LEAWSAGIPVVASNTGGIGKIISHGKDGLLFKNGQMDDLYEKMDTLMQSETLKSTLVKNSFHEVKQYDWKKVAQNLDYIYANALEDKRVS
jgi:phosphatidylinositol alpha-mannosyltransferase